MTLKSPGKNISKVEVNNISSFGIWILLKGREYFLSYANFPWFKEATLAQIQNVELHHEDHLRWPDLDVDLHLDSLTNLEQYSLVYK
ncbi:MAG: DUF2442 domain-containing protein [Candidatus Moranbacteria bacterium]|nr:DUF2442 domain-containing protein [Candidatus Moranbacteria bacterium]